MEFAFYFTILLMAITPASVSILFGLIDYKWKNRDLAFNIAVIAAFSIEIILFRILF